MVKMDWQIILFDTQKGLIQYFDKIAVKYFPHDHREAEQAVNDAINIISANDFARMKKSGTISNPRAYMTTVVTNLIRDASISKYGKCRPPEWVKRLGSTWTQIHKSLCCYQQDISQVCSALVSKDMSEPTILMICKEIKVKHLKCGSELSKPSLKSLQYEPENDIDFEQKVSSVSLESDLDHQDFSLLLDALSQVLFGDPIKQSGPILASVQQLKKHINLEPQQVLVLKLVYQENMSISQAAELLNIKRHTVDYQMKNTMKQLKDAFEKCEIYL
jgi:RNA polymerase sigma factor (sigma-70 family)